MCFLRSIFPIGFRTTGRGITRSNALPDNMCQSESNENTNEELDVTSIDKLTARGMSLFVQQRNRWILHVDEKRMYSTITSQVIVWSSLFPIVVLLLSL